MSLASGAAITTISGSKISSIEVPFPPLPTQRKIAAILSAYDDLIENNTRRIAILEELAQMLYREWFVRFRFPGHESVRMVDSPLGPIPEGWEVTTIGEVSAYLNRGVSPRYDDESSSRVINQKCIRDGRLNMELSRGHSTKVLSEKFVQFGDVLINSTGEGTLGRVTQVYSELPDCTVDSHVTIVRPRTRSSIDYFGLQLLNLQPYFSVMGFGATNQTELGRQTIANTVFLLPPRDLQERFSETVVPMRNSVVLLSERNALLRAARDLLLPRLISGELDVAELEIAGVSNGGGI